jgi:hypothetical protein
MYSGNILLWISYFDPAYNTFTGKIYTFTGMQFHRSFSGVFLR